MMEPLVIAIFGLIAVFSVWIVVLRRSRKSSDQKSRQTEDGLGAREYLLDQIFNEAPAYMVIVNYPELVFSRANREYRKLVGRDDVVGRKVSEVLPKFEAEGLLRLVDQVATTKERFTGIEVPITIKTPEGETKEEFFDFIYQPLIGANGDVYAILGQGTLVTEKVRARKAIEETKLAIENERENFRNLFKQTPELVCILKGPDHVFEFVNESHVKVLGFDATGKAVREAQPESVEVHSILDDVYRTGKTAELHEIKVTVGTSVKFFNLTYAARRDLEGKINGVMILGLEVTGEVLVREDLKKSEAQLEFKTAQLQTMIDQMPMSVVFADKDGKLIFANKQMEKVWRHDFIPAENIEQYREYIGFHPDGRRYEGKDWPIARTLMTGVTIVNEDTDVLLGDGTRGIIRLSSAPVLNVEGEIVGGVVVSEDVTQQRHAELELKHAKEDAERANQLKSAFLANMSHEIRTPLGAMIGFADLLRDPGLSRTEQGNYVDIMARNGEQLSVIINDILDLSKVEAGHLTLEFSDCSPERIAADVVSLLRVKAKEKDLSLEFIVDDSTPKTVVTDPTRLRQVLLNLLSNSIKFTKFGSVRLRCYGCLNQVGRSSVCFEIKDTGIGIPEDQHEKIFEMFVQADGSMTRRFGGTGLGLNLSRKLAVALGGEVRIVESRPQHGSKFLLQVEDQPSKRETISTLVQEESSKGIEVKKDALAGLRILVVDDAPDNQQLIWRYLTKYGAEVDSAENGLLGYRKALAAEFDLILMDIQMPEMDGYTATQKLRSVGYTKPIIALTAHAMNEVRKKCLNVGCSDHLTKPINSKELVTTIVRHTSS